MDSALDLTDLPGDFTSFEELKEDYPELRPSDWKALASAINIPIRRGRVREIGRVAGRSVQGLTFDEVALIEETYATLRADEIRRIEAAEDEQIAEQERQEAIALAQKEAQKRAAEIAAREAKALAQAQREEQERQKALSIAQRSAQLKAEQRAEERRLADVAKKGPIAAEGTMSCRKLAIELGIAQETLDSIARKNGIRSRRYRFEIGPGGSGYSKEQSDLLREIVGKRLEKVAGNDVHSLASIRKSRKIGATKLKGILEKLEIKPKSYFFGAVWGEGISTEQLKILDRYLTSQVAKPAPKSVRSIYSWAKKLGMSPSVLTEMAIGAGIQPRTFSFRGHPGAGLSKSEIAKIKAAYSPENLASVLPLSVNEAAKARKLAPTTMKKLALEFGIELKMYRFGNKSGLGITPQQLEEFDAQYAAKEGTPVPDGYKSVKRHARPRKMTEKMLLKLAEGASVKPTKFSVRGVVTDCFSDDDILKIEQAYDPEVMKTILPITVRSYASSQRTKAEVIQELAQGAKIELKPFLFGGKMTPSITPQQIVELEKAYEGLPRAPFSDESVFPLSEIADEEGLNYRTLRKLFERAEMEIGVYRFPNGRDYPGLRREQVAQLKEVYRPFFESSGTSGISR